MYGIWNCGIFVDLWHFCGLVAFLWTCGICGLLWTSPQSDKVHSFLKSKIPSRPTLKWPKVLNFGESPKYNGQNAECGIVRFFAGVPGTRTYCKYFPLKEGNYKPERELHSYVGARTYLPARRVAYVAFRT